VSLPAATTIGDSAFSGCTSLESVSLPAVITIPDNSSAFSYSSLTSVSLPAATFIGSGAFYNCTSLESVSLPAATSIGGYAFYNCTSLSRINLGRTAPTLGINIFVGISTSQTVTVRMPGGGTGYGTVPEDSYVNWGNGFRGKGWDGSAYLNGSVNPYIILVYETY
jgi:hypothetical protein